MDTFSTGLASIMEEMASGGAGFKNQAAADMILRPEDGMKYVSRILVEQTELITFAEHNYVPVLYPKSNGEKVPGFASFFCTKTPDCPVCSKKIVTKTKEVQALKPRQVLAVPLFIKEQKINKRGREMIEPVEEIKILILPPGRNQANWKQLLESADIRGTLTDRYYIISRTGKGLDTTWTIQNLDKSDFEFADTVEAPDISKMIKESGKWKPASDIERLHLNSEGEITETDKKEFKEFNDVVDAL